MPLDRIYGGGGGGTSYPTGTAAQLAAGTSNVPSVWTAAVLATLTSSMPFTADEPITGWTLNGANFEYVVTAATHGKGLDPDVTVYRAAVHTVGPYTEDNQVTTQINGANGTVTISVLAVPNERFNLHLEIR